MTRIPRRGPSIAQANSLGGFDFYLALHSNASGEGQAGKNRGIIVFYYPTSSDGKRAAELFAAQLRMVYPLPAKVTTQATTTLGEVRRPRYPANLIELGYHDNYDDARWIENNLDAAAQAIARGLTEYFGLPFIPHMDPKRGTVRLSYGTLNLRSTPSPAGTVIANLPNGAEVTVYGEWNGWYVVQYGDQVGYAAAAYIDV